MTRFPEHSIDIIKSSYILLIWEDEFKTTRIAYFERQSDKDMKLAGDILNSEKIVFKDMDVKFPFAAMRWTE